MHINYNPSVLTLVGDHFKIRVQSAITTCVVAITGRMQGEDGEIQDFEHDITITAAGAATTLYPVPGGYWLMSCMASIKSGTVNPGDILVVVELMRGNNTSAIPYQLVLSGFPTSLAPISTDTLPAGIPPTDQWSLRVVAVTDPGAGVQWSATVPAGQRWSLQSIVAALVTSATVVTRLPYLSIDDGSTIVAQQYSGYTQVASVTGILTWAIGASAASATVGATTNRSDALPTLILGPGWHVTSAVGNMQAGDTWSGIAVIARVLPTA